MLTCLRCDCAGSEGLLRTVLYNAKIPNWNEVEVIVGEKASLAWLNSLSDTYRKTMDWGALRSFLSGRGRFAVIVGYDDTNFTWADVSLGNIKARLDGEILAARFNTK